MQYDARVRRSAAMLVAAAAAAAVMTGCTPSGDDGAADEPTKSPVTSAPVAPTPTDGGSGTTGGTGGTGTSGGTGGSGHKKPTAPATEPGPGGGAAPCTDAGVKMSDAHQADDRPTGTGTGAVIISIANTSGTTCTVQGFPTVAGAGNGSPDKNLPLATTQKGAAARVTLAPGARAWTKLTFVNVQGEADGYCVSGSTPVVFPTLVVGVPGAGRHQIAMDDGQFAECDNKVTVTAYSTVKPS